MSIIDKVIAAVTPLESDEEQREARVSARLLAQQGGWLEQVLDHHVHIEQAFELVKGADQAEPRRAAQKRLALLLTGHSLAEEAVLYPALALHGEKMDSEASYVEQSAAKVQLAALEDMDPMSQDYLDKLEHIRGAVAHHVFEEEDSRFPALLDKIDARKSDMLSARYREECARYFGTAGPSTKTPGDSRELEGVSGEVTTLATIPLAHAGTEPAAGQPDARDYDGERTPESSPSAYASTMLTDERQEGTAGALPVQGSPLSR